MCIAATYTYTGGALIDTPAQRSDAQPLVRYEKHLPKEKNQNLGNDIQWPMDFYVCGINTKSGRSLVLSDLLFG